MTEPDQRTQLFKMLGRVGSNPIDDCDPQGELKDAAQLWNDVLSRRIPLLVSKKRDTSKE